MDNAITFKQKLRLAWFLLTSNHFTKGKYTKQFENAWSEWNQSSYSVFVNSGSSANLILLSAVKELYNLPDGANVLVPACTWITSVSPIVQCKMNPVFCDINLRDFSFCGNSLKKINKKIDIVFKTNLLGFYGNELAEKEYFKNAIHLSDCCEAHGATTNNGNSRCPIKVGSDRDCLASTFSFYFGHHLTTIEGGMVTTKDYDLYKYLLLKRSHGLARELPSPDFYEICKLYNDIDKKFLFVTDGYNVRNTEINALLGLMQLKNLDKNIEIRKNNYSYYLDKIEKIEKYILSPHRHFLVSTTNSSFCLPIVFKNRETKQKLESLLSKNNIEFRPIVSGNLLKHPAIKNYRLGQFDHEFPNAEALHYNGLYVGNSQFVTHKMIDLYVDLINQALENKD